jgi:GNAT superfamily N-acetyltransferase
MSSMADIRQFVPASAPPGDWALYHAYRRRRQRERRPDEPLAPDDVVETMLARPDPREDHHRYHVVAGDEMIGELHLSAARPDSPEYETNRHLLWADGYVLESHRRRGIGRSLLPLPLRRMEEHGATVLSTVAEEEPGHAFLGRLGAEPRMVERASRLDLGALDWAMVERWAREGAAASPGARLELYPRWVPDDRLEEHCAAATELMNTMPFEGLDHGDIVITPESAREWHERMALTGSANPTCVVREPDGAISGMTDVIRHLHEPGIVRQNFTGVHPQARGRGLGKWLKAAMLLHVREAYPDTRWISTENAGSNQAMLAINHALGFRLHRTSTFYQVDRETLRRSIS